MSREERDQALYDAFAEKQARKDLLPASAFARRSELESALGLAFSPTDPLGTVLEIGCGIAAPARYLNGRYTHYIGVDQSAEMIRVAQIFNNGNLRLQLLAQNIKHVELPDHIADMVLSVGALHHMSELDAVFSILHRLAKPGTLMIAREPQNGNPLIQLARWVRARLDSSYSQEQIFFAENALLDLFRRNGLIVKHVAFQGYLTTPFAQVVLPPQVVTAPLSRLAARTDRWLYEHMPRSLQKLSFNIVVVAQFPEV
jgi:SAM-dependent methyltransferase